MVMVGLLNIMGTLNQFKSNKGENMIRIYLDTLYIFNNRFILTDKPLGLYEAIWKPDELIIRIPEEYKYTLDYDKYPEYFDYVLNLQIIKDNLPGYIFDGVKIYKSLDLLKKEVLMDVKMKFTSKFASGVFESSLGFPVDCRRYQEKNDLENLINLESLGFPVSWMDANGNLQTLSEEQVQILKNEMRIFGLSLYQKKWQLTNQIEAATTVEELKAININF